MEEIAAYRQEFLSALEQVVVVELSRLVPALPPGAWHTPSGLDGRTPHYILAHMHMLDEHLFNARLRRIVAEDTPLLPLIDDNAWLGGTYEPAKPVQAILDEFYMGRKQEIGWLRTLSPADWSRTARHPWWGVRTLQWWAELQLDCSQQGLKALTAFLPAGPVYESPG